MIRINNIDNLIYWINPRHIIQIEYRAVSDYMYKHYSNLIPDGVTHYTLIRMLDGCEYEVLSTVEELLKLIQPYLGDSK